jgi:hypothetical protein
MSSTQLPLEYLVTSSKNCLEGFELARLNRISELRKEFSEVFDELVEAEIGARIARWILDGRRTQDHSTGVEQLVSIRASSRELAANGSETQQLLLARVDPGPHRSCDSEDLSSAGGRTCNAPNPSEELNRESRTSPERESVPIAQRNPIPPDAFAAQESLEQSAACHVRRIGYCGSRPKRVRRRSPNRTSMLPFPTVSACVGSANVATPTAPAGSRAHLRKQTALATHHKVVSLLLVRPGTRTGVGQIRKNGSQSVQPDESPASNARGVVRPFRAHRAPLRKHLVCGNLALSRF